MAKIYIVGLGPGDEKYLTPEAARALDQADVIIGYTTYLKLVPARYQGKRMLSTPMRQEIERCRMCIDEALDGNTVALICSGDAGVYGMASPMLALLDEVKDSVPHVPEVEVIAGLTAANSGAALLGAPLANDYCVISLSDLLTAREAIENRITAACKGDFVIVLYNPASGKRKELWDRACGIIGEFRGDDTPCGIVKNIGREDYGAAVVKFGALKAAMPDMHCTVFIGNSATRIIGGHLVTDRGYT